MNPELRFTLTPESAARLDEILATNKIRFVRLTREQFDILAPEDPHCRTPDAHPYTAINGLLEFSGHEFPCTLKTTPKSRILEVTPSDLEEKWCDELIEILERAFPQPERGPLNRPQAERS